MKCQECNKEFKFKYEYDRHVNKKYPCENKNNNKKYPCKYCNVIFTRPSHLKIHEDTKKHKKRLKHCNL